MLCHPLPPTTSRVGVEKGHNSDNRQFDLKTPPPPLHTHTHLDTDRPCECSVWWFVCDWGGGGVIINVTSAPSVAGIRFRT